MLVGSAAELRSVILYDATNRTLLESCTSHLYFFCCAELAKTGMCFFMTVTLPFEVMQSNACWHKFAPHTVRWLATRSGPPPTWHHLRCDLDA